MALYIFSDAHLGANDKAREKTKLERIDFWFEYKHAIPKDHHQVICWLGDLVRRGIKVEYVSGNHDFWMGDFFPDQIGVSLHRDTLDLQYNGKRLHLTHGDGIAKKDGGYRFLKRILRNRFNIWLYRKLPPDWAIPLAKWVSGSSREYTKQRDADFTADYEAYATEKLAEGYDLVAIGHLHIPIIKEISGGHYINTGDMIEHFSYARVDGDDVRLEYLK